MNVSSFFPPTLAALVLAAAGSLPAPSLLAATPTSAPAPRAPAAANRVSATTAPGKQPEPKIVAQPMNIDFTPRWGEVLREDRPMRTLYLQNGDRRIFLDLPFRWEAAGSSSALVLTPAGIPAKVELRTAPAMLPDPLKPEWIEAMKVAMVKAAPKDSLNARWLDDKVQPLGVNNWRTYETRMSYELFGTTYVRSALYIQLNPANCLEVTTLARESDFGTVRNGALTMLASWMMPPPAALARMLAVP